MAELPEIKYVKTVDGLHVAYNVVGEGPPDLIVAAAGVSSLEVLAYDDYPPLVRWRDRLASIGRLITFDKRGTGLSDPVPPGEAPTLEERMDDLRAVMDATGVERAALLGFWEGNAMAALFAATYPQRVSALILYGPLFRFTWADDYPWAPQRDVLERFEAFIDEGTDADFIAPLAAPSVATDTTFRTFWARLARLGGSPAQRLALQRMNADIDARAILGSIRVPTLVLRRQDDASVPVEAGRWAASQIPGARFVVTRGRDHLPYIGDFEDIAGEIEEFLTGGRRESNADRVLATVMFVDIVDSTKHAAELGDARWKEVVDHYEWVVEHQLERFRGRLVKTLGDGSLATFDGPARAIRCAGAIRDAVRGLGISVRGGLHTGEIELRGQDIAGIAVHIAQRVSASAGSGEVLASSTVKDLVAGSGIEFGDRGEHELRGIPGAWRLFRARA